MPESPVNPTFEPSAGDAQGPPDPRGGDSGFLGSFPFRDRVALVVGAGGGIGAATALELARGGARVGLLGRNTKALDEVVREIDHIGGTSTAVYADVTEPESLSRAVQGCESELGAPDFLVNSVVDASRQVFLREQDEADWQHTLDVNLTGVFRICRLVVPGMMDRRRGSVVLLSSTAGKQGLASNTAYCAAKFGINGFARALAREVGPFGVRVNTVCPGLTDTPAVREEERYGRDFMDSLRRNHGPAELSWERYVRSAVRATSLGRLLSVSEVTWQVLFLLSDLASGVTGTTVDIDGGTP